MRVARLAEPRSCTALIPALSRREREKRHSSGEGAARQSFGGDPLRRHRRDHAFAAQAEAGMRRALAHFRQDPPAAGALLARRPHHLQRARPARSATRSPPRPSSPRRAAPGTPAAARAPPAATAPISFSARATSSAAVAWPRSARICAQRSPSAGSSQASGTATNCSRWMLPSSEGKRASHASSAVKHSTGASQAVSARCRWSSTVRTARRRRLSGPSQYRTSLRTSK